MGDNLVYIGEVKNISHTVINKKNSTRKNL